MPLYEYQCALCSERVEVIQKVSDPPYSRCPKCGGEMKKLVSAPAIHFKGSGFYKTDYSSPTSGAPKGETTSDSSSSKSETAKSETKSESSTASAKSETSTKSETKAATKPD